MLYFAQLTASRTPKQGLCSWTPLGHSLQTLIVFPILFIFHQT